MVNIDKRSKLQAEPFTFHETKDGTVLIYWHGKQIMILSEKKAGRFLQAIAQANAHEAQLLMARVTGNFKHGNERMPSNRNGE